MTPAMVTNAILVLVAFCLLAWAIGREPKSPLVWACVAAFALSVVLIDYTPRERMLALLLAVDALLVVMVTPYAMRGNDRASIIAVLGLAKIAFTIFAYWIGIVPNVRAGTRNVVFAIQVLTAGGAFDGGLAWLGYRAREFSRRRREVLYRVEDE